MNNIDYDYADPAMVVVQFNGTPTDQEFEDYLCRMDDRLRDTSRPPTGVIISVKAGAESPKKHRERQAKWMKQNAKVIAERTTGTAFVIESAATRFVMSSIMLLQPIPGRYDIFANLTDAKRLGGARSAGGEPSPPRSAHGLVQHGRPHHP
ncbi:MAG: hypothetical protein U0271_03615 [Polyangiaceae bacterium]